MKSQSGKNTATYQRTFILTLVLTVTIFALLTALVSLRLRNEIRKQIEGRDAAVLYSLALMSQRNRETNNTIDSVQQWKIDNQNLMSAVQSSELHGVIGLQLFDAKGELKLLAPQNLIPAALSSKDLPVLHKLKPISRFHPKIWLDILYIDDFQAVLDDEAVPLLEVLIPMHRSESTELLGIVQYWIDGKELAKEYAVLDRNLLIQTGFAFCGGSLIIIFILTWSFSTLRKSGLVLEKRSIELMQANQELVLATKMSAIGAISSHLVHGLKNPLAGLKEFVSSRPSPSTDTDNREWQTAREATNRMVEMIQEIVQVIREEDSTASYEITLEEICEIVLNKLRESNQSEQLEVINENIGEITFSSHEGNVIILILNNLIKNAIEAISSKNMIALHCFQTPDSVEIRVKDTGPGIPENIKDSLFQPCISSKPQGAGIGLVISRQLGKHISAELSLEYTGIEGTCFLLKLPFVS